MRARWGSFRRFHLLGVGGAGMSALAELLAGDNIMLSGCDIESSGRLDTLAEQGVRVFTGHSTSHLEGVDLLIRSAAVGEENEEIREARRRKIPVIDRAEMLGECFRRDDLVAVAGSHGKTTTTAILSHILISCGLDPSYAIGGVLTGTGRSGHRGRGSIAVCEADEYQHSFLHLRPLAALVTNVEAEHMEYFHSEGNLHAAFEDFLARVPFDGVALLSGDDPAASTLKPRCKALLYGLGSENHYQAIPEGYSDGVAAFRLRVRGSDVGSFSLPLAGRHNILNATAALAAAFELGLEPGQLKTALATFPGVGRRFERLGQYDGMVFFDDYAHHPTEIRALLNAAREGYPGRRVVIVFQPHLFSRTRDLARDFAGALNQADFSVVLPVFAGREDVIEGVDHHLILDLLETSRASDGRNFEVLQEVLQTCLEPGDVVLSVGAGNLSAWMRSYLRGRS